MQFDPVSQRVVLFGGANAGDNAPPYNDTWTWDGSTWSPVSTPMTPAGRWGAVLIPAGPIGRLQLIGGTTAFHGGAAVSDSWTWDGAHWVDGGAMPSLLEDQALEGFSGTADTTGLGGLIVGGQSQGTCRTFVYTTRAVTSPPAPRPCLSDVAVAADDVDGYVILFGGEVSLGDQRASTWTWNGTTWTALTTRTTPHPGPAAAAWDATTHQVVLLDSTGETWTWTGDDWHLAAADGPGTRIKAAMTYDPVHQVVVLFGGHDPAGPTLGDTWAWDGAAWHKLPSA